MIVSCAKCGTQKDKAFMTRIVRDNQEHHVCKSHSQKYRRVHGGRMVPVRKAG